MRSLSSALQQKPNEQELGAQVNELKAQLSFQTDANLRLSKELTLCLKKLGVQKVDIQHQEFNGLLSDLSYLAPLFLVYDDHIHKLEGLVDNFMEELRDMEQRIKLVADDNTYLRRQLEYKNEEILKMFKQGVSDHDNIQAVFGKLEKEDLEDRLRLHIEENHIYVERIKKYETQIYDLQGHIQTLERSEQNYINQIRDLQQTNKQLELDVDEIKIKTDVLDNKLKNQIQLASIIEEEKVEFSQRLIRSENDNKVLKHQIQTVKHQLEQTQNNSHQTRNDLSKECEELKAKEREYFDRQVHLERELDQTKDESRWLKKELDQTRSNLEQTIKMMENYENKVQIFQKNDENNKNKIKQMKEEKEQIVLDRDRYSLKEQQFDQLLQNQIMKNREEIVQLKETNDKTVEQLKNRYRIIIDQREDEIQRLNNELTHIQTLNERLVKENKSFKVEITRMETSLKSDIEENYQHTDDLHRQVNELSEKNVLNEQQIQELEQQLNIQKQQHESQLRVIQNSSADVRQALEHTRSQLTSASQELSTLKGKTSQLTRANQNLIEELQKTKRHYEQRLEQIQDEYTHKIKTIQLQLDESNKRDKQSRDRSVQLLQQYDQIEEKLKTEYNNRVIELETANTALKNQNKQLSYKLHEIKNQAQVSQDQYFGTLKKN
ncbi:hypothetical protein pb186bvf_017137 [Paramecium bursaria]